MAATRVRKLASRKQWLGVCQAVGRGAIAEAAKLTAPHWTAGSEVRFFWEPGIREAAWKAAAVSVLELADIIGIKFQSRVLWGPEPTAMSQLEAATSGGTLDAEALRRIAANEPARIGTPHADVFLTTRPLKSGRENWGEGEFKSGCLVLSLPGERQASLSFLRQIAKHEASHLFGFFTHHDAVEVAGYEEVAQCLMLWAAPTQQLCPKCFDGLRAFWRGVEAATGRRFLDCKLGEAI